MKKLILIVLMLATCDRSINLKTGKGDTRSKECKAVNFEPAGPIFYVALQEQLIEVTDKHLIACRECHATANVALIDSLVTMTCPGCLKTLGNWETTPAVLADITAFLAKG